MRRFSPGGLAGVWAEANTRADIFDALHRRETFGTSGSRMRIRFFAGDLPEDLGTRDNRIALAYERGVPMGSDLNTTAAPRFWVWATQDPTGTPLIAYKSSRAGSKTANNAKGSGTWFALTGVSQMNRVSVQQLRPVSISQVVSAPVGKALENLKSLFLILTFQPNTPAFYYARVLENPTCRWTTVLANSGNTELPDDVPAIVQERGWSSPIWSASR